MRLIEHNETDQRQHLRLELFEYAIAHLSTGGPTQQVVIVNLGLGGLQLRSRGKFVPGAMCALEIPSLNSRISVEVRYCETVLGSDLYAVGMRFRPSRHAERMEVAKYVNCVFQSQRDRLTS